MNPLWGSVLIAIIAAAVLALRGRPAVASMIMAIVLTFWFAAAFGFAGAYMELKGKETVERSLNMGGMVVMGLFILFFVIVAIVVEGKRSNRLKKAEDRLRAIDRAQRGTPAR